MPGPLLAHLTATAAIAACAGEEKKNRLLPALARGEQIATLALLVAAASWDPAHAATKAGRGTRPFVPDTATADWIVTVAADGVYLSGAKTSGVIMEPMPALDMTRKLYTVHFSGGPGDKLAADTSGIVHALAVGAVALCAELTGGMQKVLDLTVAYVKTGKRFGKPVGSYQLVQAMCADMPVAVEGARSATYFAAYSLQEGLPETQAAVSVAKSYISDAARETGNKAIQCHGGMGFTGENDVHLYYRRAKASEIAYGDAVYHRERLALLVL